MLGPLSQVESEGGFTKPPGGFIHAVADRDINRTSLLHNFGFLKTNSSKFIQATADPNSTPKQFK